MPITVEVRSDWLKLRDTLERYALKQMPFATANALTEVAKAVQGEITSAMPAIFDRPTPFTRSGFAIKPAHKGDLVAEVFARDIQGRYLRLEETGGEREPAKTALVIPVDIGRNQYGNIPRGALQRLKGRGKAAVFVGTVKGIGGFWQRGPFHSIRLLAAFEPRAQYRPRFGYHARTAAIVGRTFGPALGRRLAEALATARA